MELPLDDLLEWIAAFQQRLVFPGLRMDSSSIFDMAEEIHTTRGDLDPGDKAQTEWDLWSPEGI